MAEASSNIKFTVVGGELRDLMATTFAATFAAGEGYGSWENIASDAYALADAMLVERETSKN